MALVALKDVSISFGGDPVLHRIAFQLEPGQRVCLLGRNGEGKTTLMKIISGELVPDEGAVLRQPDATTARLAQEVPESLSGSVFDVVAEGLGDMGEALAEYHRALIQAESGAVADLSRLGDAQHRLETLGAWDLNLQVETVLTRMGLDPDASLETLSGGMKRRVLLARTLVAKPDILLLDEPTNHLDIDSIQWLETFLARYQGTVFFVTHDRAFMRGLATRILEIDRGNLFDWSCDYDTFCQRKQQLLEDEEIARRRDDRLLSQEEAWIRQGIKARRTRNEGRVKRLLAMRERRRNRRMQTGAASLVVQNAGRSGDWVARLENVSFGYGEETLLSGLTTTIQRGDRIGVVGPNGCGKTTLLKLLLGRLAPTAGQVKIGSRLEVVYFDQLRGTLDPTATVFETVNEGKDKVEINGRVRSVFSYLQDFLFTSDRARSPVSQLSGGERNRLMLAKLLTRPANVLVMDEPTNDLDVETLELLEEKLLEFEGTLLVVSHDREFINHVVTGLLVFEDGTVREYAGGCDDWLARKAAREAQAAAGDAAPKGERQKPRPSPPSAKRAGGKLSYRESRELDALPEQIETLETVQGQLYAQLGEPKFYQTSGDKVAAVKAELDALAERLETLYTRWEELEGRREAD